MTRWSSAGAGAGPRVITPQVDREALVEAFIALNWATSRPSPNSSSPATRRRVALRRWMDRYAGSVAAKRGMAESLRAIVESGAMEPNETRERILGAVDLLLRAGAEDGSLRADVRAADVVSSLIGINLTSGSSEQTGRLLDLLVAGVAATG